jgi:uncharacterized protein (DUF697 family)
VSVNKKKLPKAIRHAADDLREVTAEYGAGQRHEMPARLADSSELSDGGAAVRDIGPTGDADGAAPVLSQPVAGALAPTHTETDVARRRSLARRIVERHAAYSAVGGIIPVPIANVASITAVIVRMVKVLSDLYGVPFQRDRARAMVVGLMGGAMPTGLAAVTASTLVYIVPGSNLIGLAVSSIAAIACTRGIGRIFIEHFESGAALNDISAVESS